MTEADPDQIRIRNITTAGLANLELLFMVRCAYYSITSQDKLPDPFMLDAKELVEDGIDCLHCLNPEAMHLLEQMAEQSVHTMVKDGQGLSARGVAIAKIAAETLIGIHELFCMAGDHK